MSLTPRLDKLDQNLLINGNFAFNQRGDDTNVDDNRYVLDRWIIQRESAASTILEVTQESGDVPLNSNSRHSMKVNVGTASGAPAIAARRVKLSQYVEGHMMPQVIGKRAKLRFWVKSNLAQTFAFGIRSNGSGVHYFLTEYTINAADTWELKEILLPEFVSSIDWQANTNNRAALFDWALDVGTDFHGATNTAFQPGTAQAPTGYDTQFCDTLNNYMQIADVVVMPYEINSPAPGIEGFTYAGRNYMEEFQLCQRYLYVPYDPEVGSIQHIGHGRNFASNQGNISLEFPVKMRAVPTLITGGTISDFKAHNGTGSGDISITSFTQGNTGPLRSNINVFASPMNAGGACTTRRIPTGTPGFLYFDAEL